MMPLDSPSRLHPFDAAPRLRLGSLNIGLGFARKLPDIVDRCLALSLDVIALQEIGDPPLLRVQLSEYLLVCAAGPSQQEAGVALLLAKSLAPRCRAYKRSKTGRLVGAVLEPFKGHQLLIVSAYMPSGLDHCSAASPSTALAHELYAELLSWTNGMQQVVLLGDLNETRTPYDRFPLRRADQRPGVARRALQCLIDEGFTDAYRLQHADAQRHPGFTHRINSAVPARCTRSRIDYIWTRNVDAADHVRFHIDSCSSLRPLSHHSLICLVLQIRSHGVAAAAADEDDASLHSNDASKLLPPPALIDLGRLTDDHVDKLTQSIESELSCRSDDLAALLDRGDAAALSSLASQLTDITHSSALASLPVSGSAAFRDKSVLQLQQKRRDLSRLLHISSALLSSHSSLLSCLHWRQRHRYCIRHHHMQWRADPHGHEGEQRWVEETQQMIRDIRASVIRERQRMKKRQPSSVPPFESRFSSLSRIIRSDALPSNIFSVVNAQGELTHSAAELKDVMADHFESVFSIPPDDALPLPLPPPAMLLSKPGIEPEWFDGLMRDIDAEELFSVLRGTSKISKAPGEDQVSTGVWKLVLRSPAMLASVLRLFSACLRTSTFPSCWKTSVIVPLVKDASKERSMSNIRPISLQSCLGKLLTKVLAHRLTSIFSRHPVLNSAQRGFVLGGTTCKCIDELLDAWGWSRQHKREQYTLLYDIKQAYDSVQTDVLVRSLRRLHLPPAFVALVADSLQGLASCVRTAYGYSRSFPVQRSIRQGDPLAPILFVILMDALHDGLETNPFTGQQHGLRLTWPGPVSVYLPSLGYADDSAALSNSLEDLRHQNDWVQYFMSFNRMRLNPLKCELVGRNADGEPVADAALAAAGVLIDGHTPRTVPHQQPIRYLGVHACFDGSWKAQQNKTRDMVLLFSRMATRYSMPIGQAVLLFNCFLRPKLEIALHYVHGPDTTSWLRDCDRILIGYIKHASSSLLRLSHSAVALAVGLVLPSWLEPSIKVSELFFRVNSSDPRWGRLGRVVMRQQCGSDISDEDSLRVRRADGGTMFNRSCYLAVHRLQWELHLARPPTARARVVRLLDAEPILAVPDMSQCSSAPLVRFTGGDAPIAHDVWSGWGSSLPPLSVHVYTDGSFSSADSTSAWSVAVGDEWLEANFGSLPVDEALLLPADVGGSTLAGSGIDCTVGVYPAELQAIARALAMFPLSFHLHIHSDSQASLKAIDSCEQETNERKRFRMAARPLLRLIGHLLSRRRAAGGSVTLSHVKAHSDGSDMNSVGNRLADFQANRSRVSTRGSTPFSLQPLPIESCENHLFIQHRPTAAAAAPLARVVIDDPRRVGLSQLRQQAMSRWSARLRSSADQGLFACQGMVDLGRMVMRLGSPDQQATLIHVATNSIHWFLQPDPGDSSKQLLRQLHCDSCDTTLTLLHFFSCPLAKAVRHRTRLRRAILLLLGQSDDSKEWLRTHPALQLGELVDLLRQLFPSAADAAAADGLASHSDRCLVGALTQRELGAACRALGFQDKKAGLAVLHRVQLACLDRLRRFFASVKKQRG